MTRSMKLIVPGIFFLVQSFAFAGIQFRELNFTEALEAAKKEHKMVFADVYAVWCGPCKWLSAEVFTDETLGDYINAHFVPIKIDGEQPEGMEVMMLYDINAYPTMLFLDPDKMLKKQIIGAESAEVILKAAKVVNGDPSAFTELDKRFQSGDRDRMFLRDYFLEKLNSEENTAEVVEAFMQKYPKLEMTNETEFMIFCLGVVEPEHKDMKDFLKRTDYYGSLFPELAGAKMSMILAGIVEEASLSGDPDMIRTRLEQVYPSYQSLFGEEAYPKQELEQMMLDSLISEE